MPSMPTASLDGVADLIKKSLEKSDPRSFTYIQHLTERSGNPGPLSFVECIKSLTGITVSPKEVALHWKKILDHKRRMELKLCRTVHIKTAAVDYYDQAGISVDPVSENQPEPIPGERSAGVQQPRIGTSRITTSSPGSIAAPGYHQERLKEEMLRARRYKHALSAMMLTVDISGFNGDRFSDESREKVLGIVDSMITKAIRNVDIRARHSNSQFMLILPNTNKREAQELASRLLKNISTRLHRLPDLPREIPLAVAVGQCGQKNDTSGDFIKRLENLVESDQKNKGETVLLLE
jgi:diguanylate cyclase (GGDEF)-like protein